MTEPYPPPTPEERQLRAQRLGGGGIGAPVGNPLGAPGVAGGSWLQQRAGGIPYWGIGLIAVGLGVIGLVWWNSRKNSDTSSGAGSTGQSAVVDDSSGIATGQYETIISQLRDIQGQESQELPTPASTSTARQQISTGNRSQTLAMFAQNAGVTPSRLVQLNPQYRFPKGTIAPHTTLFVA